MSTTTLNEQTVLDALRQVKYPGFSRDIVSFGFVKDLTVGGGNVSFRLALTTDAPAAAEVLKRECETVLRSIAGVTSVTIAVSAAAPQPPVMAGAVARKDILKDTRFTIAIASGKGGVGKSTVSANLAIALKKIGYEVGLMDSDIYGPSQQMMMGITSKPYVNEEEKILPIERFGVRVMSIGFLMDVDTPVIWRGPMIFKAVEQFLGDVAWGTQDFLLVDLPPGTGDAQLTLTQKVALSGAVIVTTPQDVALIDARKGLAMFQKVNVPVLGIVENMSYYLCPKCGHREEIFKHGGGRRTAEQLNVPFLGEIPLDPAIRAASDAGTPVAAVGDPAQQAIFAELAERLWATVGARDSTRRAPPGASLEEEPR